MAVTARFIADFQSFHSAVDKAEAELKSLETGASKVSTSLNRMADSFSGRKLVQDANLAAKAIEDIGGVSKLTRAEQDRVNATMNEALAKYKALGVEAPAHLRATAEATNRLEPPLTLAQRAASLLTSTFGQFTFAGLATSAIQKLTDGIGQFAATGLKLPAMQQSFQRLTGSIHQNAGVMLSGMNEATRGLVADFDLMASANKAMLLGLPVTSESMKDLAQTATILGKAMGQDATKSLDDLITALGRSSPMILDNLGLSVKVGEANEAYAKKLGKTAEQLTQSEQKMAFYEAAMEAARKKTAELGDQTQTLGEIAESVWVRFGNLVSQTTATLNVGLGAAVSSGRGFVDFLADVIKYGGGAAISMSSLREQIAGVEAARKAGMGKDVDLSLPVDPLVKLRQEAEKLRASAILPLTAAQKELALAFEAGGKSANDIATKLGVSERAVTAFLQSNKNAKKAVDDHTLAIESLVKTLGGANAVTAANQMVEALRKLPPVGKLTADAQQDIAKTMETAIAVNKKAGIEIPEAWKKIQQAVFDVRSTLKATNLSGFVAMINDIPSTLKSVNLETLKFPPIDVSSVQQARQKIVDTMKAGNGLFTDIFGTPKQFGEQLSATIIGAIQGGGDILAAAGGLIGSKLGKHIGDSLGNFFSKEGASKFSKALGGMFEAVLPAIGSLMGPLLGKIGSAFSNLFGLGTAGRDLVKEFAGTFDTFNLNTLKFDNKGFDNLHAKLLELGADGEKLWVALTQGVGRNNPEQAKAVIEAVTAALDKHKTKQEEVVAAAEKAGVAESEAYKKAKDALATIDNQIQSLSNSIAGEAPEEFMGIVEQQTRARIEALTKERDEAAKTLETLTGNVADSVQDVADAIRDLPKEISIRLNIEDGYRKPGSVTPEPPDGVPGFASGTRGRYLDFGSGTLAMLHGRERVMTASEADDMPASVGYLPVTLMMPDGTVFSEQIIKVIREQGLA